MTVRLHFYILNEADRNDSRSLRVGDQGQLITDHPPAIGDLINLDGQTTDPAANDDDAAVKVSGSFRVIDRRWLPASFGSTAWPYGERQTGHEWLDVMLVPAPEFFAGA
jgi:hypothetical protein